MIKLKRGLYEGKDVGYSQFFGGNREWYARFGLSGHNGIDIPVATGTKLYSAISGTVTEVALDKTGYGNYIKIENDECGILYGHMRELSKLAVGTHVKAGDLLGYSGNTGNSTGSHLHWGVFPKPRNRNNGFAGYIDPFDKKLVEWVDEYEQGTSTDTVAELRKALEEMTANKDSWKQKAKDLEADIKDLKKDLKDKESTIEKLKTLCADLEDKRNNLELGNMKVSQELSSIKIELENALELIVDLRKTISRLESKQPKYTNQELLNLLKENIYEQIKSIKLR